MATFDEWLRQLAAASKGPVTFHATRGRKFETVIALPGDWTGSTMRGEIRLTPDAGGGALASFTISAPAVDGAGVGAVTRFTVSLAAGSGANSTGVLPADAAGSDHVETPFDLLLTPLGGAEELLFGGTFNLIGRITA